MNSTPSVPSDINQNQGSSLTTILNSIRYDSQVRHWFTTLILHPDVKKSFLENSEQEKTYRQFYRLQVIQDVTTVLLIILTGPVLQTRATIFIASFILFASLMLLAADRRQKDLVLLSRVFLLKDHTPEELAPKTLYQLSEIYSRQYHIPSLVDTVFFWDRTLRFTLLTIFVFCNFLYPMPFWNYAGFLLAGVFLAVALIQLRIPILLKSWE